MKRLAYFYISSILGLNLVGGISGLCFAEEVARVSDFEDEVQIVSGTVTDVGLGKITILKPTDKTVRNGRGEDIRTKIEEDIFNDISLDKEISYAVTPETKFENFKTLHDISEHNDVEITYKTVDGQLTATNIVRKFSL